jgi:cystathionine beta-lyase family protein involved in aluminum resistance
MDKSSIIQLQRELISENKMEIKAVETNIQTEIKSYRYAVSSQNVTSRAKISIEDVKQAVKSVTKYDTRSRNVMVLGLKDEEDLESSLKDVFRQMDEKPQIYHCERLGNTGYSPKPRPAKVTLAS